MVCNFPHGAQKPERNAPTQMNLNIWSLLSSNEIKYELFLVKIYRISRRTEHAYTNRQIHRQRVSKYHMDASKNV